jgi:hypothetical protein
MFFRLGDECQYDEIQKENANMERLETQCFRRHLYWRNGILVWSLMLFLERFL